MKLFIGQRLVVLALVMAFAMSGCGHAASTAKTATTTALSQTVQHTSFGAAGCSKNSEYEISQSMTGAISACLRVGALPGGPYSIVLNETPISKGRAASAKGFPVPTGSATGPPVKLSLSPSSGKPGTKVVVTGVLSTPLPRELAHGNLCWDGCRTGLQYSGVNLKWISPTTFQADLVIPSAPWISANPVRVTPLATGDYPISVQCLGVLMGCGLGGSEGSATFHLSTPSGYTPWCRTVSNCAALSATPPTALPGDIIKVTGFAPLLSVIGSDQPIEVPFYQLKVISGIPKGPQVVIQNAPTPKDVTDIYLGHAQLMIQAPPTFASLGKLNPSILATAGLSAISRDPTNPTQIDWCSQGVVRILGPNGTNTISTSSVGALLKRLGFGLSGLQSVDCAVVASNGAGSIPKVVVAAFAVSPQLQVPQVEHIALMTQNGGTTWAPVPVPKGADLSGFGGFRYQGKSLEALFSPNYPGSAAPSPGVTPLVEATSDGGSSWNVQNLSCPASGLCVTFGPFIGGNCAMVLGLSQPLIYSANGGQSWQQPGWPQTIRSCSPAQLATLPNGLMLLLESESQYLVRQSSNGGKTWSDISVPVIPGIKPGTGFGVGQGGLVMLPGGSLLVTGQRGNADNWELLQSSSTKWCSVVGLPSGVERSVTNSPVYVIGNKLWWLTVPSGSISSISHINISDLHC